MFLNRGAGPRGRILSEDGFHLLTRPANDAGEGGHTMVAHCGGMIGYYARILGDLDDGLGVALIINGPGSPKRLADYVLQLTQSAVHGKPLPPLPPDESPTKVKSPAEYAGTFTSPDGRKPVLAADKE